MPKKKWIYRDTWVNRRAKNVRSYIKDRVVVDKRGCWIWKRKGFCYRGHQDNEPHRAVWLVFNGPIPEGKMLCHHCDVPSCVNPKHLYVGTAKTNSRDYWERHGVAARKQLAAASAKGLKIANENYRNNPALREKSVRAGNKAFLQKLANMPPEGLKKFVAARNAAIAKTAQAKAAAGLKANQKWPNKKMENEQCQP